MNNRKDATKNPYLEMMHTHVFRKKPGFHVKIINFLNFHENIAAALFFVFVLSIFFFPVVFMGKTLTTSVTGGGVMPTGAYEYKGTQPPMYSVRDPGAYNWVDEPLSDYVGKVVKNEFRVPLWNPNMAFGYPILGGLQVGIFFPLNYIVFLFSSELAWDVFILLKFFLAGFLTYLFARRIGLDRKSGLLAGTAFMFNGYFINYLNMAHFSIEAMTPLLLLSYEVFLSKPNIRRLLLCVVSIALLILPGMPEASFFAIFLGSLWFLFSYFFLHRGNLRLSRTIIVFLAANVGALLLTAIQLLPFIEILMNTFNAHSGSQVGLSSIPFHTVISVFYPYIFNPIYNWLGQFHYVGLSVLILASIAFLSLKYYSKRERGIILFFAIFAIMGFLKVYGNSLINWIGSLPVLNTLIFEKYGAPSVIFALDILAAFGFSLLTKKFIRFINTKILAIFALLGTVTVYSMYQLMGVFYKDPKGTNSLLQFILRGYNEILDLEKYTKFFNFLIPFITPPIFVALNLILALIVFAVFYLLILNANCNKKKYSGFVLFVFVFLEFFVYTLPLVRADRYETFKKPPFIEYLQKDKSEVFRIYGQALPGQGVMLYPNISSVFDVQDIRFLIALGVDRYFAFIKNVVGVSMDEISGVRFTGSFPLASGSRYLGLMNVKYILFPPGFGQIDMLNKIDAEKTILSEKKEFVGLSGATLKSRSMGGLMLHAPAKIEFPYIVDEKNKLLSFNYGIADSGIKGSDGVRFIASYQCAGISKEAINDLVDPQKNKKYLSWQEVQLDMSDCVGKEARVTFASEDNGNNAYDHFFVGNFRKSDEAVAYDNEISIVKNKDYFPRAFVVHRAQVTSDKDRILKILNDPNFNLRNSIIIEKNLPADKLAGFNSPETDDSNAVITDYKDEKVSILADMKNPGFLVLLDQYYPGWKAFVDGKEVEIYPADYIFRSVYLKKGSHTVKFLYDPLSYKIGKYISAAVILLIFVLLFYKKKIDIALK